MKNLLIFIFICLCAGSNAQNSSTTSGKKIIHNSSSSYFQGKKIFCSSSGLSKYAVEIKETKIKMVYSYNQHTNVIKGVIKKDKIYSDDPAEKRNKSLSGKLYVLKNKMFRVLNIENGDYDDYALCK
ncbi:MAG: hypothetical protein M3O67_10580 [Bacteroidota bacterium]|nr:hypothetical protein [Bacteroidota bacterium]